MSTHAPEELRPLSERILEALRERPGLKGSELAGYLGCERRDVNRCLSYELAGKVNQGSDYRWRLAGRSGTEPPARSRPVTELSRLCQYYLECISQDMDTGASVFASSKYGEPDYAQLPRVPLDNDSDWWNAHGVERLLGKVRADRGKLTAWFGYPVRLRQHRTPRWEGFFLEPVILWPVIPSDRGGDPPEIDSQMPVINPRFLISMTQGGGVALAEEAAALADELGIGAPAGELPDVDELVERLVRIRPDWDWQQEIEPAACEMQPFSKVTEPGIYNGAVIIPGERSPYTQGLETELKSLSTMAEDRLTNTALGRWLSADTANGPVTVPTLGPLLEVIPMNTEQRAAVVAALTQPHTVVTGPPGTGKSQVVTNLLINAAWRGQKVLFASKNNKAVDVVEARVNGLGNRPILLRLGAKDYQARLAGYLTQVLAGNPGPEVLAAYTEALQRHDTLVATQSKLDAMQQATLDARNSVDRFERDAEDGRPIFGSRFTSLAVEDCERAAMSLALVSDAADHADRSRQGMLVRLLWPFLRRERMAGLRQAITHSVGGLRAISFAWGVWDEGPALDGLRTELARAERHLALARRVVQYRDALDALQGSPSLETIAHDRNELAERVGQNSARLWRNWVQLAPTRLSAADRKDVADFAAALQAVTGPNADRVHSSVKQKARQLQLKVTSLFSSWAVTSLSARGRIPLEPGYFDLVVIDEASQCDIASALPLLFRAKRSVIIGDPMQLRHISALSRPRDSELQHKHGLVDDRLSWMYSVNSLFDLASSVVSSEGIVNLRDHHRSHADIIGFSNDVFYEGQLRVATRYPQLKRPSSSGPGVVWRDVKGEAVRPREGGAQNPTEARAVVDEVVDLLVRCGYTGSVGVVTPFRAQARLLSSLVHSRPELEGALARADVLVDTVHKFQGDERDVMFFSPVVASGMPVGALGFLRSNGNLFNVAITRARGLLHVVGDRHAASTCGVDYLEKFSAYVAGLDANRAIDAAAAIPEHSPRYPAVAHPERVSDWERIMYEAMFAAGLRPIPQYSVEQYDLDFALLAGDRRLAIEVDGEMYHRSWTGELCLRDQLRNQRLIELGWDVQRFWVYEIRDRLDESIQRVKTWVNDAEGRRA